MDARDEEFIRPAAASVSARELSIRGPTSVNFRSAMSAPADALNPAAGESHADHAHLDGKCTSWVDEALDAAGPEYADAPRPGSCCEKDAKASAEARRVRRVVSAADPVRKATALRTSNDPRNAFPGGINDGAIDEESDDLLTDSDEEADDTEDARFFSTKDPALLEIQAKRLAEMKLEAEKARAERANAAANASYVAVDEADIPEHLRDGPTRVVLHFPSEGSEASARVDEVFDALAPAFPQTRFARVRCPSGTSPTISALTGGATAYPPAVLCFSKRKLGRWTLGYEAFGGVERFDEERVVKWLAASAKALPGHPEAPRPETRVGGRASLGVSGTRGGYEDRESDEEEGYARRRDLEDDTDEDVGDGELTGAGEEWSHNGLGAPCAQCGRSFPHRHYRALRRGGAHAGRGFGDDQESDDEDVICEPI